MSTQSPLWLVDVSNHQQSMNWRQVKREGFAGGITKASEGTYFADAYCKPNLEGMEEASLVRGAYHFLTNESTKTQLDLFLQQLGDPEGKLVAVDVEQTNWGGDPTATDTWNFVHALRERIGEHPILLYSGNWYWSGHLGNPDLTSLVKDYGVKLWVSRYVTGRGYASVLYQSVPRTWWEGKDGGGFGNHKPTILQFTDRALVAGKYIDANAYAGTLVELKALTSSKKAQPPDKGTRPYAKIYTKIKKQAERIARNHQRVGREVEVGEEQVVSNLEKAIAYGLRLNERHPKYWCWDGGSLDRTVGGRPGCVDGPPPPMREIKNLFCADLTSLMLRAIGKPVPKNGPYPGGTRAFKLAYGSKMVPFKLSEFRRGDVPFVDFQERGPNFEGHIGVMLGDGPDAKILQSFAWNCRDLEPGLTADYTLRQSHDGGFYTHRIPREAIWR